MSGILCLKWNNHTSTFMKTLDSLRSKELYCDATIVCHGKYFPVHRFVLTTCSEYFEDIFDRMQCKHPFIIIKDLEELQLEALLNYMYKGEVNVVQDKLPGLIKAAESLRVKGLAVSEDEPDKPKSSKDKKRPAPSSPIQSKNRRSAPETFKDKSPETSDEEITEIENISPNSSRQTLPQNITRGYDNNDTVQNDRNEEESTITEPPETIEDEDPSVINDLENESEIEDIKIEPTEIFETVEDFDPGSVESKCYNKTEESLFVSLLSPSSTQLSEEDLIALSEANSHNLPQCSSWSDEISVNSDKIPDDVLSIEDIKIEEQEFYSEPSSPMMTEESEMNSEFKKRDKKVRTNETPQCPLCSYKSKYKTNMKTHIARMHSGDLPFSCSSCKYKTSTKESLKIHMRKHTGEKPYKCKLCPYRAAHYNSIKLHTNIHTTEKPFQCSQCPYRAAQKISLFKHQKSHET